MRLIRIREVTVCAAVMAAVAVSGVAMAGTGFDRFERPRHYDPPGLTVTAMAVGDVNRDGRSDVVVGMDGRGQTSVLLAGRAGRLSAPRPLGFTGSGGVAIADVNGDGNRDIVRVSLDTWRLNEPDESEHVVFFGNGRGGFGTRAVTRTKCCANDVAVADFNRDQKSDLAVAGVGVLLGDGTGRFPIVRAIETGYSTAVADLNRDGKLDLVVLNQDEDPDPAIVLLGDGTGGFGPRRQLAADDVASVAVGRFNRDRWPDLATVSFSDSGRDVRVLLGRRDGHPRATRRYNVGRSPIDVEVADLNRDYKDDLVVSGYSDLEGRAGAVRVLYGAGRGRFRRPRQVAACCNGPLNVGDFNGDRKPDLATTLTRTPNGSSFDRVSILMNATRR